MRRPSAMIKSCNKNEANEEPYYTGRVIKRNIKHTDRVFSLLVCEHASSEELCASLYKKYGLTNNALVQQKATFWWFLYVKKESLSAQKRE